MTTANELNFLKDALQRIDNNTLSLASRMDVMNREIGEVRTEVRIFKDDVVRHFAACPIDETREETGVVRMEVERVKAALAARTSKTPQPMPVVVKEKRDHTDMLLKIALGAIGLTGVALALLKGFLS
jgi:hypothetical protein